VAPQATAGEPAVPAPCASPGTIHAMAERSAVERELEEIRAQLDWVREYL
jgi:hypothetical protein